MMKRYNNDMCNKQRYYHTSGYSNGYENSRILEIHKSYESAIYVFDGIDMCVAVSVILVYIVVVWIDKRK